MDDPPDDDRCNSLLADDGPRADMEPRERSSIAKPPRTDAMSTLAPTPPRVYLADASLVTDRELLGVGPALGGRRVVGVAPERGVATVLGDGIRVLCVQEPVATFRCTWTTLQHTLCCAGEAMLGDRPSLEKSRDMRPALLGILQ